MQKKSDPRHSKLFVGLAGVAAVALFSACTAEGPTEEPPADQDAEQQTVEPQDDTGQETTDEPTETPTEEATDDATDDTATGGADPVYDIIDAVEAEYADGFIVDIDREDDGSKFDVDIVIDNEVLELEVTSEGTVSEDDRDDDESKIDKANDATVPVTEALDQAFDQYPETTFDQIDLDDDGGALHWEVELDDTDGAEINIDIAAN